MGARGYLELFVCGAVHIYPLLRRVLKIACGALIGAPDGRTVKASRRASPAKVGLADGVSGRCPLLSAPR